MVFYLAIFIILSIQPLFYSMYKPKRKQDDNSYLSMLDSTLIMNLALIIIFPFVSLNFGNFKFDIFMMVVFCASFISAMSFMLKLMDEQTWRIYIYSLGLSTISECIIYGLLFKYLIPYTNKWRYFSLGKILRFFGSMKN